MSASPVTTGGGLQHAPIPGRRPPQQGPPGEASDEDTESRVQLTPGRTSPHAQPAPNRRPRRSARTRKKPETNRDFRHA